MRGTRICFINFGVCLCLWARMVFSMEGALLKSTANHVVNVGRQRASEISSIPRCGLGGLSQNDHPIGSEFLPIPSKLDAVENNYLCREATFNETYRARKSLFASYSAVLGWPKKDNCYDTSLQIRAHEYGFFSMAHGLIKPMIVASMHQTALSFAPLTKWTAHNKKENQCRFSLGCFLAPFTQPCVGRGPRHDLRSQLPVARKIREMSNRTAEMGALFSFGRFVRVARAMAFAMEPVPRIRAMVEEARVAMGWTVNIGGEGGGPPVIGLHVRQGDSCSNAEMLTTKRECQNLTTHMPYVRRIARLYGANHVYLATDGGQRIFDETRHFSEEFTWYFLPDPMVEVAASRTDIRIEKQLAARKLDGYELGSRALRDMLLLAETDAIVGKFTSNLVRAALEVASGRRNYMLPFISLDASWCCNWGSRTGTVVHGSMRGERFHC